MRIFKLNTSELNSLKNTVGSLLIAKSKSMSPLKTILGNQLNRLNAVYMRVIRLDELKLSQEKVNTYQERLLDTQTNRRDISMQLTNIRHESNGLHSQINEAKRTENDDRYIELVRLERELKRKETTIADQLQHVDKLERDLFTALTNAIRDSHVTQRAQAEYTKYFSIILSIFGSFASFLFFMVRKEELKEFIEKKLDHLNSNRQINESEINDNIANLKHVLLGHLDKAIYENRHHSNSTTPKVEHSVYKEPPVLNTDVINFSPIIKYGGIAACTYILYLTLR